MNRQRIVGLGAIVLVAVAAVWATGIASTSRNASPPPFLVTESEVRAECMTGTFVPDEPAGERLAHTAPPRDWRQIEEAPEAMPAERGAVRVTLGPKERSAERITITAVHFRVFNLGLRPTGPVLYRPCKRRLVGAAVETDLDGFTHKILGSAQNGALTVGFHLPRHSTPIRFPWTVSLAEPLNLYLLVEAHDIYCDWTARISWTSESSHGVIQVDNGGRKYRIVDGQGIGWRKPAGGGQWNEFGSSRWIGVK